MDGAEICDRATLLLRRTAAADIVTTIPVKNDGKAKKQKTTEYQKPNDIGERERKPPKESVLDRCESCWVGAKQVSSLGSLSATRNSVHWAGLALAYSDLDSQSEILIGCSFDAFVR